MNPLDEEDRAKFAMYCYTRGFITGYLTGIAGASIVAGFIWWLQ